jgi:hypothetical protein
MPGYSLASDLEIVPGKTHRLLFFAVFFFVIRNTLFDLSAAAGAERCGVRPIESIGAREQEVN